MPDESDPVFSDRPPIDKRRKYQPRRSRSPLERQVKPAPTHYNVICISLYTEDEENLERMVVELRARGLTKANRSWLIRQALKALKQVNLDALVAQSASSR